MNAGRDWPSSGDGISNNNENNHLRRLPAAQAGMVSGHQRGLAQSQSFNLARASVPSCLSKGLGRPLRRIDFGERPADADGNAIRLS